MEGPGPEQIPSADASAHALISPQPATKLAADASAPASSDDPQA